MTEYPILLHAIQEHLEDAGIPTSLETGNIWGHTGEIPHVEVYGDIHLWIYDEIIWLAWFDVKAWDNSNSLDVNPHIKEEFFEAPESPDYLDRIETRIRELSGAMTSRVNIDFARWSRRLEG